MIRKHIKSSLNAYMNSRIIWHVQDSNISRGLYITCLASCSQIVYIGTHGHTHEGAREYTSTQEHTHEQIRAHRAHKTNTPSPALAISPRGPCGDRIAAEWRGPTRAQLARRFGPAVQQARGTFKVCLRYEIHFKVFERRLRYKIYAKKYPTENPRPHHKNITHVHIPLLLSRGMS